MNQPDDKTPNDLPTFTLTELNDLRVLVGTHPTPTGLLSQEGQEKARLIQKLDIMISQFSK